MSKKLERYTPERIVRKFHEVDAIFTRSGKSPGEVLRRKYMDRHRTATTFTREKAN